MKVPMLQSFRLENFKAVQDSRTVRFTPLTVLIGNNGSGKSSLIEGLETLHSIVMEGADGAMQRWRGFENIWHQGVSHKLRRPKAGRPYYNSPMRFYLRGKAKSPATEDRIQSFSADMEVSLGSSSNKPFIHQEKISFSKGQKYKRDTTGFIETQPSTQKIAECHEKYKGVFGSLDKLSDDDSLVAKLLFDFISAWQFISLIPQNIGAPVPQKRTGGAIQLEKDGSNIAQYLLDIRKKSQTAFDGIVETLQYVLPFARDLQPNLTSELERTVYLQLTEENFKLPGWLLSTGTLRILCLLALLRHPEPPPLIVIEEIENGLDPRTVNLIIEEIRNAVESGRTQLILTTHSPYLLDLLSLSQIVFVERIDGQPTFERPADKASLQEWAKKFAPGRLYTMGLLGGRAER